MSWPVTEAELAHYKEVMKTLKSRWAGITAEAKANQKSSKDAPKELSVDRCSARGVRINAIT